MSTISVMAITPHSGGELHDANRSQPLCAEDCIAVDAAWMTHRVLLFCDGQWDDPLLDVFSLCFGAPDKKPGCCAGGMDTTCDVVCVISPVRVSDKTIGDLVDGKAVWPTATSCIRLPPLGGALGALEIPPCGGETGCSTWDFACDALSPALRAHAGYLLCKHDATRNNAGLPRKGSPSLSGPRHSPRALHPMVLPHPLTGRACLCPGRLRLAHIALLPLAPSVALPGDIWAHAFGPEFSSHHSSKKGDLPAWDTRGVMHRRNPFELAARRAIHHTQNAGNTPFFGAAA